MRFALRALLKSPAFTLVAVLTIGVGIGANTALYSVFNRLVLNPVTLPEPESLVAVWTVNEQLNFNAPAVSWPRYELLRDRSSSFSAIATSAFDNFTLTGNGDPIQLNGLRATSGFFRTLGIRPAHGRDFMPEDDLPNGPNVVLLSHELWQTQFGGRISLIGETIQLNGLSWEVIGILPPQLSNPFTATQVFAPRVFETAGLTAEQIQNGAGYTQPIARLAAGVSLEQATAELAALSRAYTTEFATRLDAENRSVPRHLAEALAGNLRPTFYLLLGAVGFVLLIACANVASLFLSRLSARQKEIAVRQSLGATRGRIVRQFLLESLLFSVVAGGVGVLLALWSLDAIEVLLDDQLPPNTPLSLDWNVLLFTAGATLASTLLVGLVPAWQASRTNIVDTLKDAGRGLPGGSRGKRFRALLVVVEVALSVVLLVGSSLLLLSFIRLQATPAGFRTEGVATAFVGLPGSRYRTEEERARFFTDVIAQLQSVPQVKDAAAAIGLPLAGFAPLSPYSISGRPILPLAQRPLAGLRIVSDDYFRLLAIPVRAGRTFTPADREGAPGVCVINESFARRLFPEQSPLGQVILRGRDAEIPMEIVGIVGDVKSNGLNAPVPDEIYYPIRQLGRPGMAIVARTDGDAAALQGILRSAVAAVDPDQPISFFQTLENLVGSSLGVQRIVAALTAVFAAVAVILAAIGLYSVLAYGVTQRTGEIGLRMALGAQRSQVVSLVMRSGLGLVAVGLVAGLAISAAAAGLIRAQLFAVEPLDPLVYGGVSVLFGLISACACLLPSWRASRIDPLVALRTE